MRPAYDRTGIRATGSGKLLFLRNPAVQMIAGRHDDELVETVRIVARIEHEAPLSRFHAAGFRPLVALSVFEIVGPRNVNGSRRPVVETFPRQLDRPVAAHGLNSDMSGRKYWKN